MAIVCAVLVVFSITVALVVPKRNKDFPTRLLPFFGVAIALVIGMLATVENLGGESSTAEAAATTGSTETGTPQTTPATSSGPSTTTGGAPQGDPVAGKQIFTGSAGCSGCHTLADAGATGSIGPNLDQVKPSYARVVAQVTHGGGPMPAFGDKGILTQQQIEDVAAYVSQKAGT